MVFKFNEDIDKAIYRKFETSNSGALLRKSFDDITLVVSPYEDCYSELCAVALECNGVTVGFYISDCIMRDKLSETFTQEVLYMHCTAHFKEEIENLRRK